MAPSVSLAHASIAAHEIHQASCRHRRQGLRCSTCSDLAERAARAAKVISAEAEAIAAPVETLTVQPSGLVYWSAAA